ncbi:MAG: RsmB/NOP family class I SAM-dependent RNA methyltransferase [Actinobacteria bacterium]|nr:RsmB/NOP family class I SAM-dependent RNA methyltransferase [Actinomycetota bacterium]
MAAYTVMRSIASGGYANLDLPKELRQRRLSGRDAAFATELTYGATRLRGIYDRIIEIAADRPIARIDGGVLDTLRLGAHQLLGMRVPPHAAADTSVALARQVNGAGAAGLVNAVLRRISEADLEEWLTRIVPADADATTKAAIQHSHPEWIAKALRQALLGHGASTPATVDADLAAVLAADNAAAEVNLVARPGLVTVEELADDGATAHPHVPTAALLPSGEPGQLAAVRDGRAAVQDAGSQVVALTLAAAPLVRAAHGRERWLDLCAGPGGKAGLLAALAIEQRADLVANEVQPHRAELVAATLRVASERAEGAGLTLEVRTGDGRDYGVDEPAAYDRILIDAPCTGLGALRRRPEARWRRQPSDLAALGSLQRELLASALDALAPGGVAVYATCSPHLAETTFVVGDVLKKRSDIEHLDARPVVEEVTCGWGGTLGAGPDVQLWPHVHGTDGMFLALLRKQG